MERFAAASQVVLRKDNRYQALVGRHEPSGAWLLLPQTFMNASGRAVQMLSGFFKLAPAEILVAHDELDFAPGVARLKLGGGIAGHNGLRDISQRLASHEYWRLRIGIGHPGDKNLVHDWVLKKPSPEERASIEGAIERALAVLPLALEGDLPGAMQRLHTEHRKPDEENPVAAREEEKPASGWKGLFKGLGGGK